MGLHDREYYRDVQQSGFRGFRSTSVVWILIAVNIAVWILQVVLVHQVELEGFSGCVPRDLFERGFVWQIFTSLFLHAPDSPGHIIGNMLFLFFFGRELEGIYGKRDFLIFYFFAGAFAMFLQAALGYSTAPGVPIIGASGSVLGVVVLFTFFFPKREIYLGLLIPIQAWLLCVIFIIVDVSGALGGGTGIAHWAHLGGAAVGVLYRFVDLRWDTVRSRYLGGFFRRLGSAPGRVKVRRATRPERGKILKFPIEEAPSAEQDRISARIDELLEKISQQGQESLSKEEMEFLKNNSRHYRSR